MAWIKIDDQFSDHPKIKSVGAFGAALQVSAFCYCGKYLTDGFLSYPVAQALCLALASEFCDEEGNCMKPAFVSGMLGKDANEIDWPSIMVESGLWDIAENGYLVHDYLEYNPSKTQVLETREKRSSAGKIGGQAKQIAKQDAKQNASKLLSKTPSKNEAKVCPVPVPVPIEEETHTPQREAQKEKEAASCDLLTQTVKLYNENRPAGWVACEVPSVWLRQNIPDIVKANKGFDIVKILKKAKQSEFLSSGVFDLVWLFDNDRKRGRLNYKRVLDGEFDNGNGKDGGRKAKPSGQRAGNLTPSGIDF